MQLFQNNASGKLLNNISAAATTITLRAGYGTRFPVAVWPNYFKVTLEDEAKNVEVVRVTRASGSDTLVVRDENGNVSALGRAQEGTSARSFAAGSLCELRLTAGALNDFSNKVARTGDTMTGPLTLHTEQPAAARHAAPKAYVDQKVQEAREHAEGLGTVRISVNDTTAGVIELKLVAGVGISFKKENAGNNEKLVISATGAGVPTGAIVDFPCETPPEGYVEAAGQLLVRSQYPDLWAFAEESGNLTETDEAWTEDKDYGKFSPGDGSTTFRVPDLRGLYRRGHDGGRELSSMTVLGRYYADDNKSHTHPGSTISGTAGSAGAHTHTGSVVAPDDRDENGNWTPGWRGYTTGGSYSRPVTINEGGAHTHPLSGTAHIAPDGSTEVKVKTVPVLVCMKT